MEDWVKRMVSRAYRPTCCICGCDIHMESFGAAKVNGSGAVFWHDRCYQERYGKTPEQYDEMKRAEIQTELEPEQQKALDNIRKERGMAKTESIYALVFENGKCWRERRDGYPTKVDGLFVCKTKHLHIKGKSAAWVSVDDKTGMRVTGPFGTKKECMASITEEVMAKLAKHRESHRYRGAVRANELVYARGSMPSDEFTKFREKYAEEELEKFKEQHADDVERAAKEKAGADVKATVNRIDDGITEIVIEPKRQPKKEEPNDMEKRIEELEQELKATRAELEQVWKENATLKAKAPEKPQGETQSAQATDPEPDKGEDAAAVVSLQTMQAWAKERGLVATQKNATSCIWVEGDSREYADELKGLGFRFAKKRKSWYFTPAA